MILDEIILNALKEDIGDGDHSSLSSIPENAIGTARLLVKEEGVIAGVELAKRIFELYDPELKMDVFVQDGSLIQPGDLIFEVRGKSRSILSTERIVLNFMQRMSGVATQTNRIVKLIDGTNAKLLDTRKTTPGIRHMEKWAVRIGGGHNHRFGLYDMIMLKDNHIDYAGGIYQAVVRAQEYLRREQKDLKIEVEVRNENELREVLKVGGVDRVMFDNFTPERIKEAMKTIPKGLETEASGGITIDSIRSYAETGVDFISVGALTHSVKSIDLSLKAVFQH